MRINDTSLGLAKCKSANADYWKTLLRGWEMNGNFKGWHKFNN